MAQWVVVLKGNVTEGKAVEVEVLSALRRLRTPRRQGWPSLREQARKKKAAEKAKKEKERRKLKVRARGLGCGLGLGLGVRRRSGARSR